MLPTGVVYYVGRVLVRTPDDASLARWLVYGLSYRWLAALSYTEMEAWEVPRGQLVELGMVVEL